VPKILIVDDDPETCRFMAELLAAPGREISTAQEPGRALALAREDAPDVVVSDINLGARLSGLDVLRSLRTVAPDARVVLVSGFGTLETAIDAVRNGAFDYVSKPFDIGAVRATVERALERWAAPSAAPVPPSVIPPAGLIGRTAAMLAVYKQIALAADSTAPVLITGESGTGKELVARAIHQHGRRAGRPFVPVNCGAIADTLLESELFGHVRGAFTGAVSDARGLFEQANSGTILLDEIGETSAALQVKLLRVLQDGEVRPVGSTRVVRVDVRVVAATNADLEREVSEGRFRQDLFYRLSVLVIKMPALRERREDIPLLVERFLQNAWTRAGRRVEISPGALQRLVEYRWPGNVRELENTIERLVLASRDSVVQESDLPFAPSRGGEPLEARLFADLPSLDEVERRYLAHVLEAVGGNRTRAAEVLGIDRRTLYRMAERFGLNLSEET
jgi:DNA-binding NtrC family response regulator